MRLFRYHGVSVRRFVTCAIICIAQSRWKTIRAAEPANMLLLQFRQAIDMTPWAYCRALRLAAATVLSARTDGQSHRSHSVGYPSRPIRLRVRERFGEPPSENAAPRCRGDEDAADPRSVRERPVLSILPPADAIEERQVAQAISEHLAAALSRSGVASVNLVGPAIMHRPVVDKHYSLSGRLTLAGGKIRLTIRLVSDVTGYHVWAESFDGVADELFAMQDRMADAGVIAGVCPALISKAEIDRLTARRSAHSPRGIALRCHVRAGGADVESATVEATQEALDADPAVYLGIVARGARSCAGCQLPGHHRTGRES